MTFALLAAAALAGTFDLTPAERVVGPLGTTIGVTNTGTDAIVVRGEALARGTDGRDTPTDDLEISPAFITIPAGETGVLKVDPKRGARGRELAYTVAVEEMHLGFGYATVPVYLPGSGRDHPEIDVNISLSEGVLRVDVANPGDAHLDGYTVEVVGSQDAFLALRTAPALLVGASRREAFFLPPSACAALTALDVRVTSEAGTAAVSVPVDANACARLAQASR